MRLQYNAGLDGIRGLGLIAILFYHSGVNWIPGGFLSVSTFFTLSGFLITTLLLYEWDETGRIDMSDFWSHRFRRLMPGALLALGVIALLGATMGDASQVSRLRGDGLAALFYVSNWRFIYLGAEYADLFASPSLVQHFWSLSIEEQFYLTFPLLAIALLRLGSRRAFVITISLLALASSVWMAVLFEPDMPTSRLYYGTDTRAAEILIGALLGLWYAGRRPLEGTGRRLAIALGVVGLAGNFYYWFGVSMQTAWLWQGGFLLYAITTAAIIVGTLQTTGPARAFLSCPPLPWLGKISYGVYIYHFAFYVTLTSETTGLAPWPLFVARVLATFAVAVPSYYWLEVPIRRGRMLVGWRPWLATPLATVAVVAMLVVATLNPPEASVDLSTPTAGDARIESSEGSRILVVGGSIAVGLGRGLVRWASRTGEASVMISAIRGCGISRGGRLMNEFKRAGDRCDNWPTRWQTALDGFMPDIVVVLVSGWDTTDRTFPAWGNEPRPIGEEVYDAWLMSEYDAAIDLLTSRGARIVWLTSPCLAERGEETDVWDPRRTRRLNEVLARVEQRHADRLDLVDLNARVCPDGRFTNELDGMKGIRPDGAHLSNQAADWVADWLGPRILSLRSSARAPS